MADEQDRAAVIQKPLFQEFERFRVEVVGRLVENQDVRGDAEEFGKKEAIVFAPGEGSDRRQDLCRREEKILEIPDDMPGRTVHNDGIVAAGDIVLERLVFIELRAELIE